MLTPRCILLVLLGLYAGANAAGQTQEVVRVGSAALRGVRLPLSSDTVDNYVVNGETRELTGTTVRSIIARTSAQELVYEIRTLHWGVQGDTGSSTMVVRADDLSLVFHRVKAARDSAAVSASRIHVTAWVVLPNQPVRLFDRALEAPVFGVEGQIPWLFPHLPLAPGYTAIVPHFSQWEGREVADTVRVSGGERVTIGSRTFDCWKVDLGPLGPSGYRMTRWIETRTKRVIQSALRGTTSGPEYWSYLRSSPDAG
jgi:hypothetical protein